MSAPRQPPPIALKEPPIPINRQRAQDNGDEDEEEQNCDESDQPSTSNSSVISTSQLSASILPSQTSPIYAAGDLNNAFLPFVQPNLLEFSQQIIRQNCMHMTFQHSLNGTPTILSPNLVFQQQIMMNGRQVNLEDIKVEVQNPIERSILEHQASISTPSQQETQMTNNDNNFVYSRPVDLPAQSSVVSNTAQR